MTICDQQLAHLKNRLQMPLIVREYLQEQKSPNADETYALNEMLSDYSAEDAILAVAFSLQEIAYYQDVAVSDLAFLHLECERLIERYSARDALSDENPELWEETQQDMISEIAEDLEGFLDLLSLCMLSFEVTAPQIHDILKIMDTQLQAHLIIIDEAERMLDNLEIEHHTHKTNNVITFPIQVHQRLIQGA